MKKYCQRCHTYQFHNRNDPWCKDCMEEELRIGQALKKELDKSGSKDSKGRATHRG